VMSVRLDFSLEISILFALLLLTEICFTTHD
jgi:hypothetical protein